MTVPALALIPPVSPTAGLSVLDMALSAGILVTVTLALCARTRMAQAVSFLTLGVVMSLTWLRLGVVDVALAEGALGTGLLSALMVWLVTRSRRRPLLDGAAGKAAGHSVRRWLPAGLGIAAGMITAVVAVVLWFRVEQQIPRWQPALDTELPGTGVEHGITGVLLAFRAYDTLLESAVLMFAGITVLSLGLEGRRDGELAQVFTPLPPVPSTLRWFVRLSAPVLLLLGLWLLFAGSSDSGGAFQSGAVLAGLFILLRTAHVSMAGFTRYWLRPLLAIGIIVFIAAGMIGPALGEAWLAWDPSWAFAAILTVETTLTAGIAAGLYLLYLGLEDPGSRDGDVVRP
ncbi:DUF4040 domain-containing protein [Cellulosimicrobium funkei]|nr:DUF4040 domain-containing protein [Cellulosimicrobium funkei]